MRHVNSFSTLPSSEMKKLFIKATGQFYTSKSAAAIMYESVFEKLKESELGTVRIVDPFAGDGRLITWFIESWNAKGLPKKQWDIYLFDLNNEGLDLARRSLEFLKESGVDLSYSIINKDTFTICKDYKGYFDYVITNPPWETIKPDKRELKSLHPDERDNYIDALKEFDAFLAKEFPLSQPKRKFAGWGTSLSRVGAEVCLDMCKPKGIISILLPASFFADEQSFSIRKSYFSQGNIDSIYYFPAEAKLFSCADVASCAMVFTKDKLHNSAINMSLFDKEMKLVSADLLKISDLNDSYLSIPVSLGANAVFLLKKLQNSYQTWGELEGRGEIWAGREVDETGSHSWLKESMGSLLFIKGKMIGRYCFTEKPRLSIIKDNFIPPASCMFDRIAWRDISRPSQKRRVIATIIPRMTVSGNSLGVVYFKSDNKRSLYALLGIMNSLCFEFQVRAFLATGHISLSALRKTVIPNLNVLSSCDKLISLVDGLLNGKKMSNEFKIESIIAREIYGLSLDEFTYLIDSFLKITLAEKEILLNEYKNEEL